VRYTDPQQFEPLLPQRRLEDLYALAQSVTDASLSLRRALHPSTAATLAQLLRAMNSYYSNKIEGHSTHPLNIDRGLRKDFSAKPRVAQLQRLALAHIEAEEEIESWINNGTDFSPFSVEGIRRIHEALYRRLPEEDRTTGEGRIVEPGVWRNVDVVVGRHVPPTHDSMLAFLARYQKVYDGHASSDKQLVKIASAHQRLTWIHPFLDGNGRVARLATHAALYRDFTGGLWSVCRGLARTQQNYYAHLESADELRRGDLDGRGNLTEEGLWQFCFYFLTVCRDQTEFMRKVLDFDGMRTRIRALIVFRSETDKQIRREAELPLHYLFTSGPLTRAEFKQMTGLGDKVAQIMLSRLLKTGLVESDTPLGPVRFGLPLDALQFYFPDLYPEAATRVEEE
jgi:Fic family protein